jgi:biofilm PGA synthesis protein PgaD
MEFTGQGKQEQSVENEFSAEKVRKTSDEFLVKSRQPFINKVFAFIINVFLWMYMAVIIYFFMSAVFEYNDYYIGLLKISFNMSNHDIRMFLLKAFIYFSIFFTILISWKYYNKIRYGRLNRRSKPLVTTDEDMLRLNLIDEEVYNVLKTDKVIIFEKNPVRELERRN